MIKYSYAWFKYYKIKSYIHVINKRFLLYLLKFFHCHFLILQASLLAMPARARIFMKNLFFNIILKPNAISCRDPASEEKSEKLETVEITRL